MHLPSSLVLLAASLPLGLADQSNKGLNFLAKKAGLKYFGAATDSPGFRERAGHESAYAQYDEIMWDSGEFGQTTPTNGQKVRKPHASTHPRPFLSPWVLTNSRAVDLCRAHPGRLQLHRG